MVTACNRLNLFLNLILNDRKVRFCHVYNSPLNFQQHCEQCSDSPVMTKTSGIMRKSRAGFWMTCFDKNKYILGEFGQPLMLAFDPGTCLHSCQGVISEELGEKTLISMLSSWNWQLTIIQKKTKQNKKQNTVFAYYQSVYIAIILCVYFQIIITWHYYW